MDPARYAKVMEVFVEVVRWPPARRAAVIDELTADDPAVRDEVRSLLAHHREPPAGDAIVGAIVEGRYRLVELVDTGRRGDVYVAERVGDQRALTVELYPADDAAIPPLDVSDLARDIRALPAPIEVGTWVSPAGPRLYIVLEPSDARALAEQPPAEPWPLGRVLESLDPVAHALMAVADRGFVHGAVDARHVVAAPTALLLGLGGAQRAGIASDHADAVGVAPEQRSPNLGPLGPWTDVYGLARVVELLLGRAPDAIEAVMTRALATHPIDRYQDVRRFWTALRHGRYISPTSGRSR